LGKKLKETLPYSPLSTSVDIDFIQLQFSYQAFPGSADCKLSQPVRWEDQEHFRPSLRTQADILLVRRHYKPKL